MTFFSRIKEGMDRFMSGRYGTDALNRGLLLVWLVFLVFGFIFPTPWLFIPQLILCVVIFFRMLSKNAVRRRRENAAYYEWMKKIGAKWRHFTVRIRDRKIANFFRCPQCRADIRMPKKSGSFKIRCPKCGTEFTKTFH